MNVEKLILKTPMGTKFGFSCDNQKDLWITVNETHQYVIDRSQAHLLMLYLQEHLK